MKHGLMRGNFTVIFLIIYCVIEVQYILHTVLKIDAINFYCKITVVWLDSSVSVANVSNALYPKQIDKKMYKSLQEL